MTKRPNPFTWDLYDKATRPAIDEHGRILDLIDLLHELHRAAPPTGLGAFVTPGSSYRLAVSHLEQVILEAVRKQYPVAPSKLED